MNNEKYRDDKEWYEYNYLKRRYYNLGAKAVRVKRKESKIKDYERNV